MPWTIVSRDVKCVYVVVNEKKTLWSLNTRAKCNQFFGAFPPLLFLLNYSPSKLTTDNLLNKIVIIFIGI